MISPEGGHCDQRPQKGQGFCQSLNFCSEENVREHEECTFWGRFRETISGKLNSSSRFK